MRLFVLKNARTGGPSSPSCSGGVLFLPRLLEKSLSEKTLRSPRGSEASCGNRMTVIKHVLPWGSLAIAKLTISLLLSFGAYHDGLFTFSLAEVYYSVTSGTKRKLFEAISVFGSKPKVSLLGWARGMEGKPKRLGGWAPCRGTIGDSSRKAIDIPGAGEQIFGIWVGDARRGLSGQHGVHLVHLEYDVHYV